jgi:DNA polymerase I
MVRKTAYFIDADYILRKDGCYVRLHLKGKKSIRRYLRYDPYFYVDVSPSKSKDIEKLIVKAKNDGEVVSPLRTESCEKIVLGKEKTILKVFCKSPKHIPILRNAIAFTSFEANIPFSRRFMMDFRITPFSILEYERGEKTRVITQICSSKPADMPKLTKLAFDIETYNPQGAPREKKDPVIMVSYVGEKEEGVITYKKIGEKFVHSVSNESEMLESFVSLVRRMDPDILYGYNSANFDIPYMIGRAKELGMKFNLGRSKRGVREIKKGMVSGIKIDGRVHLDLYPTARFFGFTGVIKAQNYTLDAIAQEVLGKKKKAIKRLNIWEMWDKGELKELAEYSLIDSQITYELGEMLLPLEAELASITKMTLFDVSLATSGQLVESLLMFNSFSRNEIIPNVPSVDAVREREGRPIQGAFVKLPEPGIYENIAVLDFRGLYPSIIVSYNIDPFTITKEEDSHCSPSGTCFSGHKRGLIPSTLEFLLDFRAKIKQQLKKTSKGSADYVKLSARSQALKILSNSFYGYLGYARSRWYSRECAESTTAWGRKHIQDTISAAEKEGFEVLYGDTDSVFILYKKKEDVLSFIEKINKSLPEKMELELEGFFTRGVFVSKKVATKGKPGDVGAKKKYALLGDDGRIKIRGFELVRRDWSQVAKDTQLKVLEAILKEGSKEKAVKIVRDVIERLKSGKVPLSELSIVTQLNKSPGKYEVTSPELSAAMKASKQGVPLEKGSIVSYVITKGGGKTISDKAELVEFAKDYDPDYYINNQVLPAVMKILKELGYEEHDLKFGGKQKNLDSFF